MRLRGGPIVHFLISYTTRCRPKWYAYTGGRVGAAPATVARLGKGEALHACWTWAWENDAGYLIGPWNGAEVGITYGYRHENAAFPHQIFWTYIGAINELGLVLSENLQFGHGGLELRRHARLAVCGYRIIINIFTSAPGHATYWSCLATSMPCGDLVIRRK